MSLESVQKRLDMIADEAKDWVDKYYDPEEKPKEEKPVFEVIDGRSSKDYKYKCKCGVCGKPFLSKRPSGCTCLECRETSAAEKFYKERRKQTLGAAMGAFKTRSDKLKGMKRKYGKSLEEW